MDIPELLAAVILDELYLNTPLVTTVEFLWMIISLVGKNTGSEVVLKLPALASPLSFSPSPNIFPFTKNFK